MTILSYLILGIFCLVNYIKIDVMPPKLSDISKSLNNEIKDIARILKRKNNAIDNLKNFKPIYNNNMILGYDF